MPFPGNPIHTGEKENLTQVEGEPIHPDVQIFKNHVDHFTKLIFEKILPIADFDGFYMTCSQFEEYFRKLCDNVYEEKSFVIGLLLQLLMNNNFELYLECSQRKVVAEVKKIVVGVARILGILLIEC